MFGNILVGINLWDWLRGKSRVRAWKKGQSAEMEIVHQLDPQMCVKDARELRLYPGSASGTLVLRGLVCQPHRVLPAWLSCRLILRQFPFFISPLCPTFASSTPSMAPPRPCHPPSPFHLHLPRPVDILFRRQGRARWIHIILSSQNIQFVEGCGRSGVLRESFEEW